MTRDERRSIENAIWLCETCAKVIDAAPDAFTKDGLIAWKQNAELTAARDSRATEDQITILLIDIKAAHELILNFCEAWQESEPPHNFNIPFETQTQAFISHMNRRLVAYHRQVLPAVTPLIEGAEIILGSDHPIIMEIRERRASSHVNYIEMRNFSEVLLKLKSNLELR